MIINSVYDNCNYYKAYRKLPYFIQCKRHLFITVLILVSVLDYKYNSK